MKDCNTRFLLYEVELRGANDGVELFILPKIFSQIRNYKILDG